MTTFWGIIKVVACILLLWYVDHSAAKSWRATDEGENTVIFAGGFMAPIETTRISRAQTLSLLSFSGDQNIMQSACRINGEGIDWLLRGPLARKGSLNVR